MPYQENIPPIERLSENGSGGKNTGSIIGIIIIVLVLIVGGLYFWGKRLVENKPPLPPQEPVVNSQ